MSGRGSGRVASAIRLEPAVWLLPVSLTLGYLVAVAYAPQPTAYALTIAIRPHEAIIVLAPLGAAAAAWKAGRWRRARWVGRPWARSSAVAAARAIVATTIVQVLAYEAIAVWVTVASGRAVPFEPVVPGIAAATIAGWTALGFAAGWWLRVEIALPVVVVGSYLGLVYPPAMEPLWLRHLTGTLGQCCFPDATLDPDAVRAMLLVPTAAVTAALLLVEAGRRPAVALAALATAILATIVVVPMVDGLGADPVAPREGRLVCAGTPEVCLWPEQADDLQRIASEVARAAARWSTAGLRVPDRLSARPSDRGQVGSTSLVLWDDPSQYDVVAAMASGVLPEPSCDGLILGSIYESRLIAVTWLTMIGGVDPATVAARTDPATFHDAEHLSSLDEGRQMRWLADVEAADPCTGAAVPLP